MYTENRKNGEEFTAGDAKEWNAKKKQELAKKKLG